MADGGTFVMTYWSGVVDENDLCFLGGTPHGLMDVFGLRSTELDALYDQDVNAGVGEGKTYEIRNFCDLVKTNGAETLLAYRDDFYAGYPALTKMYLERARRIMSAQILNRHFTMTSAGNWQKKKAWNARQPKSRKGSMLQQGRMRNTSICLYRTTELNRLHFRWIRKHTSR